MTKDRPVRDADARLRIITDLDRNLLVEAGAGSGKTQKLAERMAAGIARGAYELERMAAVTFTRKAAAELRGRFQVALEGELAGAVASDAVARATRLRAALSNLERFFAGTIHAFCARLLRERPVEAGVSPGFTELDDAEDALLREQSWRDYRAQAKASGDRDLLELLDAGITAKQLDKAFKTICLYEDVTFPVGDAPKPDTSKAWNALARYGAALKSKLPSPVSEKSTCKTQERAGRFLRRWRAYERGQRDAALLAELLRIWESRPDVTLKWWPPGVGKQVKQLHEDFRSTTVLPYFTEWRQYLYGRCIALLTKARDAARVERRRRNALSFNDLLIITADVLRTNADVRRALQQKYHWLFVDEFQDTDPVQAEIMFLLATDEAAAGTNSGGSFSSHKPQAPSHKPQAPSPKPQAPSLPVDWRTVVLRPGALFVVGDPKQSIFRFRRADIDIYNDVRARLAGPDGKGIVKLTTNFRSVPDLCEWANQVFEHRFPATPTAQAPMFARLDDHREPSTGPAIAVLDVPAAIDSGQVPGEEAARMARYIQTEVAAKRRRYGDFLILTRKKKRLRPYADALEALQIPIEVTGAGAFGESEPVRDLALLLYALADPQDAVALIGVLRGPLFGLSDRDLFAYRQAGGRFGLFAVDSRGLHASASADAESVVRAIAALRRWLKWTRMLPAGAALERILDDSGYLALAATSPGGVDAGDLLHAIDRVRAVVEDGFTLAEAADALASWSGLDAEGSEESTEVDSLPLEPGRRDVVRLMNLHKAKGLEATVVFLADPLGGFDPRVDVRIVRDTPNRDSHTALGYFKIEEEAKHVRRALAEPAGWDAHEAAELAYLTAEMDRLFYVAATRARDMLVVGRYLGGTGHGKPAWEPLSSKLVGAAELTIPSVASLPAPETVDLSAGAAANAVAAAAAAHDRAQQPSWFASSVTKQVRRLPRIAAEAADTDDPTRVLTADTLSRRADAGVAWGALVHGLLEHAMRHKTTTREDLRRLARWLTVDEPQLRAVIEEAIETVESVAKAEFWKAARAAPECHEEVPFAIRNVGSRGPEVLAGAIDLVHCVPDGWRIIDYKTDVDAVDVQERQRYLEQLARYGDAWGRISGTAVTTSVVSTRQPQRSGS